MASMLGAEAAPTQVEKLVCFRQLDFRTGWPTCAEMPGALHYRWFNLSERRFGAHMDAFGAHMDALGAHMDALGTWKRKGEIVFLFMCAIFRADITQNRGMQ